MTLIFQLTGCGSALAVLGFIITFLFKAFKAHNDLIKFQYENARDAWRTSGEPSGMLGYRAPTQSQNFITRLFTSNPAFTGLAWTFYTPSWVKDFPEAQDLLRKLRRNTLAWNVGVILWVIYFIAILFLFGYLFEVGFLK